MKKYLLLIIILFLPLFVYAEDETKTVSFLHYYQVPFETTMVWIYDFFQYAEEYTYQDGVYTLVHPTNSDLMHVTPNRFYYTCKSATETSCETIYAVYAGTQLVTGQYYSALPFSHKDGGENDVYFHTAEEYTKEGNTYTLKNPVVDNIFYYVRISNPYEYGSKYFCEDFSDSCDNLINIYRNTDLSFYITESKDDLVFGNGFDYQDGTFIIKDIVPTKWPDLSKYSEYVGTYTCMNQSTSCDTLYRVTNYESHHFTLSSGRVDEFSPDELEGTVVNSVIKNVTMMRTDTYSVQNYIQNTNDVWIEDTSIVKIENGVLVPLKKGTTTILIQNDDEVLLFHVVINDIDQNPKTSTNLFIFIVFGIVCFCFILAFIKHKNNKLFNQKEV